MIIRQEILFSFEELQKCEPKSRIEILMDNLDVTPCVQKLPVHTLGRRPYPHAAMLRALVAMHLLSMVFPSYRIVATYRKNIKDIQYSEVVYTAKKVDFNSLIFPAEIADLQRLI